MIENNEEEVSDKTTEKELEESKYEAAIISSQENSGELNHQIESDH